MGKAIYIAGKISGDPEYKDKFMKAEEYLTKTKGYEVVLNPSKLPEGLTYEDYFPICFAMIDAAKAVYMMLGWEESRGANRELGYAIGKGYEVIFGE